MTDASEIEIHEQTPDRRYYTIIPNLAIIMKISPYAKCLYLWIKRRAGDDGQCWENTRHISEGCQMSVGQVTKAKRELEIAGLITIKKRSLAHGHFPGHIITIVDIWKENIAYFENNSPVHQMNTSCSPGEMRPVHQAVLKNNPSNKGEGEENFKNRQSQPVSSSSEAKPASSGDEGNNKAAYYKQLNNHQTIRDIKELIKFLPPKLIRERIVKTFPDGLDMKKARDVLEHWIATGYSPKNFDGWLFDWYLNDKYYQHPGDKKRWKDIQHPEERGADNIEDTK